MTKDEINKRLKKCMVSVLGVDESMIDDEASMDNLEMWDSLRHINLIIALEQEFGISFPDEEVAHLTSVRLLDMSIGDAIKGENQ